MKHYLDEPHGIPPPEVFDLGYFLKSTLTTDACDQATKHRMSMGQEFTNKEKEL